jgi:hypothetical protein
VAVLVAALLTTLLGIMAIAVDGGLLLDNHQRVQGAADAAVLAAATELFVHYPAVESTGVYDPNGAAAAAAVASASANGFPNDGSHSTVTVNLPPKSGPFTGKPAYVEVIVTYYQPRYFSGIWGSAKSPVAARSVARGRWASSNRGIVVLDPVAKNALNAAGTGTVTVTGGAAVIVNSSDGVAGSATGGGTITAPAFEITGGYTGSLIGEIHTGVPPTPDHLRYLPAPPVPPDGRITTVPLGQGNKQYTLTPGRHRNLPSFNSGDRVVLQQASANGEGIYYIDGGGFKSTGASIVMDESTSGGVMIYNDPASSAVSEQIQITGNSSGTVNLSGLTSGPYAGMLLWQNRGATQQLSVAGGGNFTLRGTFYAANALLQVTGSGDAVIGSQYVSRKLNLGGGGNTRIDYTDSGTARLREVVLVE